DAPEKIAEDADYGRVVCACEGVSRGEIRDALKAAVPARDLEGLRRRTRCLGGRCQGANCVAEGASLVAAARGTPAPAAPALEAAPDREPTGEAPFAGARDKDWSQWT